ALGACTAPAKPVTSPTPIPTHVPGALNVTALLDLSGSRWPSGAPQRDALQLWTDQHATAAPRVRLRIVDVAGSDSRPLNERRRNGRIRAGDHRTGRVRCGARQPRSHGDDRESR